MCYCRIGVESTVRPLWFPRISIGHFDYQRSLCILKSGFLPDTRTAPYLYTSREVVTKAKPPEPLFQLRCRQVLPGLAQTLLRMSILNMDCSSSFGPRLSLLNPGLCHSCLSRAASAPGFLCAWAAAANHRIAHRIAQRILSLDFSRASALILEPSTSPLRRGACESLR